LPAFLAECELASGADARLDAHLARVREAPAQLFGSEEALFESQFAARTLVEDLAVALQASLLVRFAPEPVADAFVAARLDGRGGRVYGTLPRGVDAKAIVDRAAPV
jgi:putative acyl-CoA dehydrogenase